MKNKFWYDQIHPTHLNFDVLTEYEVKIDQLNYIYLFLKKMKNLFIKFCENKLKKESSINFSLILFKKKFQKKGGRFEVTCPYFFHLFVHIRKEHQYLGG